jgi:uncharacterized membrane protein YeiH
MMNLAPGVIGAVTFGHWSVWGTVTTIDLIAASTNALNGALLARRPDHYRNFTVVGILLMALLGGLGGGITRDLLAGTLPPTALINPAYITLCLVCGALGYHLAYAEGQLFREGLFQFMTSFALPWYAIAGVQKGIAVHLPVAGALFLAVVGPTAGRYYIDLTSGVPPKQFIRGEWFVGTALLTGVVWLGADAAGATPWLATGSAVVVGYTFRVTALYRGWEEPLAQEPKGVYKHDDGRPLLGRKLQDKSQRELRDLGLLVEPEARVSDRTGVQPAPSDTGEQT